MTLYEWLCLLGAPALIAAAGSLGFRQVKKRNARERAVSLGIQALLRDRLLSIHRECAARGGADLNEYQNFENLYAQYHALGANGVMDSVREEMKQLYREGI